MFVDFSYCKRRSLTLNWEDCEKLDLGCECGGEDVSVRQRCEWDIEAEGKSLGCERLWD